MARGHKSTDFSKVATANIQRSKFKRGMTHKTTFDANYLIPIFVDEVLPGDTFNMRHTSFCRLATPIKPSMDNLKMDIHYFFVPNRLVWDNWEKFMGAQENPGDSTDFLVPTINLGGIEESAYTQSIFDYFGIPRVAGSNLEVNALPFRAYNLVYNEWYRDQNLQDSIPVERGDSDSIENYKLRKRGKRHDYFTSALPWPQKGEPVSLSLTGDAPVGLAPGAAPANGIPVMIDDGNGGKRGIGFDGYFTVHTSDKPADMLDSARLFANMDGVTAVTINQLRQAFQLQRFLERDARSGTRYIEVIKSHFGVTNPDFRLQRPEYLGGSKDYVGMTTIAQTSETASSTPQGNLSAMGVLANSGAGFNKSFTEHGYIIGLASVYADLTYQEGLNRMWQRETRVDFYWPAFAHLGEQEIFNSEIYAQGDPAIDKQLFGYQERYAEYRYLPSRVSGLFRSSNPTSLDVWHYAEDFDSLPVLSSEFIECNSPVKRNSAVPSEPDFICDFDFNLKCIRPIPMYGTPGFVDHF